MDYLFVEVKECSETPAIQKVHLSAGWVAKEREVPFS